MSRIRPKIYAFKMFTQTPIFAYGLFVICMAFIVLATSLSSQVLCIIQDGERNFYLTMVREEADILGRFDIVTRPEDEVLFTGFNNGYAELNVNYSVPVKINADGETHRIFVVDETAAEVLNNLDIEIGEFDEVSIALHEILHEETIITVNRVSYEKRVELEEVPHETVVRPSTIIAEGTNRIITAGSPGEREIVATDKYVNGEIVETIVEQALVTLEPITEVKLVGVNAPESPIPIEAVAKTTATDVAATNASINTEAAQSTGGPPADYLYVLENQTATAYTAPAGAKTSTGRVAAVGYVAVNPAVIPYGTKLYIETEDGKYIYGYAVAADTGGALMSGAANVDLYFNTKEECTVFGRRKVKIYVLS